MEPTYDHAGPVARTVNECALLLGILAGDDGKDPRCSVIPYHSNFDYVSVLNDPKPNLNGLKVGILREAFGMPGAEKEVDEAVIKCANGLKINGAEVFEVSVPMHKVADHIWTACGVEGVNATQFHGGGQNHGFKGFHCDDLVESFDIGFKSRANLLSPTNKAFLLMGEFLRRNYGGKFYAQGRNLGIALTKAYDEVLKTCDVLVMPTLPMRPTPIPESNCSMALYFQRALEMIANTSAFNVTGHPALTVPVGLVDGLPVGIQIVGKKFDERACLRVGYAVEVNRGPMAPPPSPTK